MGSSVVGDKKEQEIAFETARMPQTSVVSVILVADGQEPNLDVASLGSTEIKSDSNSVEISVDPSQKRENNPSQSQEEIFSRPFLVSPATFWRKLFGDKNQNQPPSPPPFESFYSMIQAVMSISILTLLNLRFSQQDFPIIIGSFGASAVLLHGAISSPLAQPRNLILGHMLSAIVGVTVWKIFGNHMTWITSGLAVGIAIFAMSVTGSVHPPGGATALIAVIGSDDIHKLGYFFVVFPCLIGTLVMLTVSLIFNNCISTRRYPQYWGLFDRKHLATTRNRIGQAYSSRCCFQFLVISRPNTQTAIV